MNKIGLEQTIINAINKGLKEAMEATGNIYILTDMSIEEEPK